MPQSTIRFGRPGILRGDPDYDVTTVVNHCLGAGSFTSRFYKEVREKRGLCYSVYSQNSELDHTSMFVGATSTKNERAQEAIDTIRTEIDLMAKDGIGDDELDKAKKYLVGSYALRFDTSRKIAGQLCNLQLDGYGVDRLDSRNESIARVTRCRCRARRQAPARRLRVVDHHRRQARGDVGRVFGQDRSGSTSK